MAPQVKLLYLYEDLLNLYGESGNVKMLTHALTNSGAEVCLQSKSLQNNPNEICLADYDFVYMASGTERHLLAAVEHFCQIAPQLPAFVDGGGVFLATGNSMELLGQGIFDGIKRVPTAGLFAFETVWEKGVRQTGDVVGLPCPGTGLLGGQPVIGFVNKCSRINGIETPLFNLKAGAGLSNNGQTPEEGLRQGGLLATHLIGPLLVRNPQILDFVVETLGKKCGFLPVATPKDAPIALAYEAALAGLKERFGAALTL